MSRHDLFIIVEGRDFDAAFYSKIAATCGEVGSHEVWVIDQINGLKNQRGKSGVLELHDIFKGRQKLVQRRSFGVVATAFCVDRDYDHVLNRKRKSRHIIYTLLYNVEAEIVTYANLASALEGALSLDSADARRLAHDVSGWNERLGSAWQGWIELCILAHCLSSACEATPRVPSRINEGGFGPVDAILRSDCRASVVSHAKLPVTPAREGYALARARNLASKEGWASLINGKHFSAYLEHELRAEVRSAPVAIGGFTARFVHCALMALDVTGSWADRYRNAFSVALSHE